MHPVDASAPVRWTRRDGTVLPIERLELHDLVEAQQHLLGGTWSAEAAPLMLAAIENELQRRWKSRAPAGGETDAEPEEPTSRAA